MDPVTLAMSKRYARNLVRRRGLPVLTPAGFTWTDHPLVGKIYTDGEGVFWIDGFDVSTYRPAGKTYYVDVSTGNDSNDGLSPETALATVATAIAKSDVDLIMVASGLYDAFNTSFYNKEITKSIGIMAMPGHDVTFSQSTDVTWEPFHETYPNVYVCSRSGASRVVDKSLIDEYGDYAELTKVDGPTTCNATPGSFVVSGSNVLVHTHDSRPPDSDITIFLGLPHMRIRGKNTLYLEGIKVEGGDAPLSPYKADNGDTAPTLYAKNCWFRYAAEGSNGVEVDGAELAILQGCVAARNADDGFNHHALRNQVPYVVEIDCIGRDNGAAGNIDNGSTIHDAGKIIRVNCVYFRNVGPNVGDINSGTQSWNLGCIAFESTGTSNNGNFVAHTDAEMWLDSCVSYGSTNSLIVQSGATARVRQPRFDEPESVTGTRVGY